MDINSVTAMLNSIPTSRSNYEFKNFNLEQYGTFPRQLRAMLLEKETLHNSLSEIEAEIDIIITEAAQAPAEKLAAVNKMTASKVNQLNRTIVDLKQQMKQVDNWLDLQDPEDCQDAIDNFEEYESDHWTDTLGKEAAIEVLSHGRTQKSTMAQLSQLPLVDYKRAVVIIAQLANFLKDTTEKAESVLYPQTDALPNSNTQETS
jgi:hypothetical protein